ncbi:unnamed protein product [Strongylus vulgaris]|uniref:Uncharacterized protein n=1 Tax=Strongylus vulgaris TaxID=40348 RepID=A0A3P7JAR2_STRVU|nr:unnamed protein product [Strongylus vulgaris]
MYATATFPYVVTTIFLIRSVTLDGAMKGLWHMINPDVSLIAFGSYNPLKNDCKKDAKWLALCNVVTSLYTAVVIFCVLGYMGHNTMNTCIEKDMVMMQSIFPDKFPTVEDVRRMFTQEQYIELMEHKFVGEFSKMADHSQMCNYATIIAEAAEGTGLAFVVFTEAILRFPFPPAWSVLFFLMLLSLGLGSMFGTLEGVITSLNDSHLITVTKPVLTGILCASACLIGLLFSTRAGQYWVALFDSFAGSYALMCVAFFEVIAVVYVYGYRRFSRDLEFMTGSTPGQYWLITWRFVAPIIMAVLFTCSVVQCFSKSTTYYAYNRETTKQQETEYPIWAMFIALLMVLLAILPTFSVWFLRYFKIWKLEADIPARMVPTLLQDLEARS